MVPGDGGSRVGKLCAVCVVAVTERKESEATETKTIESPALLCSSPLVFLLLCFACVGRPSLLLRLPSPFCFGRAWGQQAHRKQAQAEGDGGKGNDRVSLIRSCLVREVLPLYACSLVSAPIGCCAVWLRLLYEFGWFAGWLPISLRSRSISRAWCPRSSFSLSSCPYNHAYTKVSRSISSSLVPVYLHLFASFSFLLNSIQENVHRRSPHRPLHQCPFGG